MRKKRRYGILLGSGVLLIAGVWLFRAPLRNRITESGVFSNPAPPPELVEEVIEASADRTAAILAAWNTGKIVQRQVAAREIGSVFPANQPLPAELESIVLTGALDVDMNVRETALGILRNRNHSALPSLAAAQLQNSDPQVRLLGLNYLKHVKTAFGVPAVIPLLDDEDPLVVATALNLLETSSGEKFGVKLRDVDLEKAKVGVSRAKAWWGAHQSEFPPAEFKIPHKAITGRKPVPAEDFSLRSLDGRKVRLADLRGKVVLINFWTTWCSACISEIPELIALQKQHADRLVIVGVSLDFVPDEHGDIGDDAAVEEQANHAKPDLQKNNPGGLQVVKDKVARTVKARGMNYTVLLDEHNEAGGRFNGGELPTTVIVDVNGNVRRRFIGGRTLPVFEAMINEASQPEKLPVN